MDTFPDKQFTALRWTMATFAGWVLGVVLIIALSSVLDNMGIEHMQCYIGVGMGAGVGFAQWRLVRKQSAVGMKWLWSSIVGMSTPFLILDLAASKPPPYKLPGSVALGALMVGVLQYFLLRKQHKDAVVWIPACFTGWILAVILVFVVDYTKKLLPVISSNLVLALINLLLILSGGIVLGMVTGAALKRILQTKD